MNSNEIIFETLLDTFSIIISSKDDINFFIEDFKSWSDEFVFEKIVEGEIEKFIFFLKKENEILLFDLTEIGSNIIHRYFEELLIYRDLLGNKKVIMFLTNKQISEFEKFENLKSFGYKVHNYKSENSKEQELNFFRQKYGMNDEEFLQRWKNGELEDTEDFNAWYVLL